jgi:mRNA interferase MazF
MTTKKPIKTYDAYEIVLIPFPFIDNSNNKKRPALVLSSSLHFNMEVGASVMAMITTTKNHPWPLDTRIHDLEAAGLPVPSIIRMKFFTLDHRLVLKKLGRLHLNDQQFVEKNLKQLLSFN